MHQRKVTTQPARLHRLPRLELDVVHKPKKETHTHHYIQTYRDPGRHRHHHHHRHRVQRRPYTYGYDEDYLSDYTYTSLDDTARVRLYTHDSTDPWSCTCYPRPSDKTIPSMVYDEVRCPHPGHKYIPVQQDYFAYPWSVQTYRPYRPLEFGYKNGQVKPPSAVTAPPFATYTSKNENTRLSGGNNANGDKPPPHSAPEKPLLKPLLSAEPSDRRLRRANRRNLVAAPALRSVPENEEVTPYDSVSQVMNEEPPKEPKRFDPDSLRLGSVNETDRARVDSELRHLATTRALITPTYRAPPRALSTPRAKPRPGSPADNFPQTPTRIFKGEYVDPRDGQKYQYDIKYGRLILDGTRNKLKTV